MSILTSIHEIKRLVLEKTEVVKQERLVNDAFFWCRNVPIKRTNPLFHQENFCKHNIVESEFHSRSPAGGSVDERY